MCQGPLACAPNLRKLFSLGSKLHKWLESVLKCESPAGQARQGLKEAELAAAWNTRRSGLGLRPRAGRPRKRPLREASFGISPHVSAASDCGLGRSEKPPTRTLGLFGVYDNKVSQTAEEGAARTVLSLNL